MSKIKTSLLRNVIIPFGDLIFGQKMMRRINFLEEAQYWPLEKINERRARDLQALIQTAYSEVPIYHQSMNQVGVQPGDINTLDDISKLPIITKEILRAGYPKQTTRSTGRKVYQASTSGSTGKNFYVMEDNLTAGWYRASFILSLEWAGWEIGEPHLQLGMTINRSLERQLKDLFFGCQYVSAYQLDDEHLSTMLDIIDQHQIKYIMGYPGSLYFLAKYAIEQGWNQPLRSIVTWGDTLYPHYRETITKAFSTKVFDTYGCAEGIQISAQCAHGNYHIHTLDTIVEFLDDNGNPVPPGETGNIVLTRLHPGPMPFIRYQLGDLGVPSTDDCCSCGRTFPTMNSIQGRNADVVLTPSGNRLIVHFFTGILEHFCEINSFQVVQQNEETINILIVPNDHISDDRLDEIRFALQTRGADDMNICFNIVDQIPLPSSGKHRFVINKTVE
ncbi:MAG: AMP-binding protein [Anaerolineaceae bacterium]|nr:AMP-binding protein [Anaerolineaceae bacterium]